MDNNLAIYDEDGLKSKIYTIRGVQVMLDSDLAVIYGYTTKRFNEQVKNNIEKFDDDFRFQLTKEEYDEILRSKNSTSKISLTDCESVEYDNDANSQYPPINIEKFNKSHDRFLIIDDDVYLIGASLKDLGKKMFGFTKMGIGKDKILSIL